MSDTERCEANSVTVTIDDEFRHLLRPLTDQERLQLMKNIERDRCIRDPLVVWSEKGILVDGHHRLAVWRDVYGEQGMPEPAIVKLSFRDREDVKRWILNNQNGRRNNDKWQAYHAGETVPQRGIPTGLSANELQQASRDRKFRTACETIEQEYGPDTLSELLDDPEVTKRSVERVASGELPIQNARGLRKPRVKSTPAERAWKILDRFSDDDWDELWRVLPNDLLVRLEQCANREG